MIYMNILSKPALLRSVCATALVAGAAFPTAVEASPYVLGMQGGYFSLTPAQSQNIADTDKVTIVVDSLGNLVSASKDERDYLTIVNKTAYITAPSFKEAGQFEGDVVKEYKKLKKAHIAGLTFSPQPKYVINVTIAAPEFAGQQYVAGSIKTPSLKPTNVPVASAAVASETTIGVDNDYSVARLYGSPAPSLAVLPGIPYDPLASNSSFLNYSMFAPSHDWMNRLWLDSNNEFTFGQGMGTDNNNKVPPKNNTPDNTPPKNVPSQSPWFSNGFAAAAGLAGWGLVSLVADFDDRRRKRASAKRKNGQIPMKTQKANLSRKFGNAGKAIGKFAVKGTVNAGAGIVTRYATKYVVTKAIGSAALFVAHPVIVPLAVGAAIGLGVFALAGGINAGFQNLTSDNKITLTRGLLKGAVTGVFAGGFIGGGGAQWMAKELHSVLAHNTWTRPATDGMKNLVNISYNAVHAQFEQLASYWNGSAVDHAKAAANVGSSLRSGASQLAQTKASSATQNLPFPPPVQPAPPTLSVPMPAAPAPVVPVAAVPTGLESLLPPGQLDAIQNMPFYQHSSYLQHLAKSKNPGDWAKFCKEAEFHLMNDNPAKPNTALAQKFVNAGLRAYNMGSVHTRALKSVFDELTRDQGYLNKIQGVVSQAAKGTAKTIAQTLNGGSHAPQDTLKSLYQGLKTQGGLNAALRASIASRIIPAPSPF
jgi:hypothetical protein